MTDPLANVLTVDVEEYYHGIDFLEALGAEGLRRLPSRVVPETQRLLDLLDESGARGTFFTLGLIAQRAPRLIREIVGRGHEVAAHGWDHSLIWTQGRERFRADVRRTKHAIEQAGGQTVHGYRAPNYSLRADTLWALDVLAEEGYLYDSSVHPIAHDRYHFPDAPRFPYRVDTPGGRSLWEVPVGTARFAGVNLPLGGGFFRLFPLALVRAGVASVNRREGRPVVFYIHPWELDPAQPRPPMSWQHRFRHYVGIGSAARRLRELLAAFRFTTIGAAFPQVAAQAVEPTLSAG